MFLIFDTETNGLPYKNDYSNVYTTQIGYIITDGLHIIVKKEFYIKGKYNIPEVCVNLNGITKEITDEKGISFIKFWKIFNEDIKKYNVKIKIAHNIYFDDSVIKQEYKRHIRKKYYYDNKSNYNKNNYNNNENNELVKSIKKYKILSDYYINKIKYNNKFLKEIKIYFDNNNKSKNELFNMFLNRINHFKTYNDNFFKIYPLDSLKFFRKNILKTEIKNHKLDTIIDYLGLNYIQTHTALDDCIMLNKCLLLKNAYNNQKMNIWLDILKN